MFVNVVTNNIVVIRKISNTSFERVKAEKREVDQQPQVKIKLNEMQRLFEVMITIKDNDRYFQSSDKDV